ncbi:glycoside hydrolase [Trametes versicolor FP-101664 SS1]|uniref:glycoside hydrolase n=1 Tax=Trametes versicolor (strain FP-101664) TaxID=717944 RepID=UPI0004623D61|nr:glycoside hydrolase [Trametes versicolor FP-101664 SS1]EIW62034.1 glycoside hydrolase [Trametes versicolor FP-101664 SS1]
MAYYPDWAADAFPPEKIDFGRFDWVDFAFAVPGADFNLTWDGSDDAPDLLRRLVSRAHAKNKKVKLSVGGWTGSRYFSAAAASPQTRAALAGNILALYTQFGLDGIDLDWEYPAQDGAGGNLVSPNDGANFLAFLRVLRATLPQGAVITAATQTVPFAGADGEPMQDVSAFAEVLDWVLLMNYDTWGSSDTPGPNAPLGDACSNSTQGSASALAALRTWTAAGFPASQLVLGVPSYGYISRTSAALLRTRGQSMRRTTLRPWRFHKRRHNGVRKTRRHRVLEWVGALVDKTNILSTGSTLVHNEDGGTDNGQVQFRDLVAQGVLQPYLSNNTSPSTLSALRSKKTDENAEGRRLFAGGGGFERLWDACSSTPFLRSAGARQVITYDDPVSLEMKAQLARAAGMRGVNLFDISGDTDNWDLADALLRGLGVK